MALSEGAAPPASRRRILLLTPRWPYPVIGGDRLRIWHLAQQLARHHDVTLLSLCQTQAEMESPLPDDGVFVSAHRVLLPRWRSWLQMGAALPTGQPLQVAYYRSPALRTAVRRLAPSHDLVCCHLVRLAPYARESNAPRWLEMTDAVSLTMHRAGRSPRFLNALGALAFRLEARRLLDFERRASSWFDLVSLVSPVDRDAVFGPEPPVRPRVVVAPNGVEMPSSSLAPAGERPPWIALLGRMDSLANQDALWFFVRQVMPGVLERVPQAELQVIGHVSPADQRRLASVPGVRLAGVVPRLEDVLARCRVGVCPVRLGAGVQNKVLNYMAHGLATVTSPIGLEGIDAVEGRHALVADSAARWIDHTVRLLQDAELATAMGAAALQHVSARSDWAGALDPVIGEVDRLLDAPPAGRFSAAPTAPRPPAAPPRSRAGG